MPTYEYRCSACHREFEYQQKMSDADLVHCEACGEDKLERLISWTSVRSGVSGGVHYSAQGMRGMPAMDRSRGSQRFTGAEPAAPCSDACACAPAASGTDSES